MDEMDQVEKAIAELRGETLGMHSLLIAVLRAASGETRANIRREFAQESDLARSMLLQTAVPEAGVEAFDRAVVVANAVLR